MREFLFRGKRCDNGEWVQGYYIRAEHHWHNHGIHKDWITLGASANGGWFALHNKYAVKAETVGQYTGLTDKNGKKIFEGDIVNGFNDLHQRLETYKVKWACNNGFYFVDDCETEWHPEHIENAEVIGNIYDNTELLENP